MRIITASIVALLGMAMLSAPSAASAQSIFLICNINLNIRTVNAQGKLIQDDWSELAREIEIGNGQYFMTTFDHGLSYSSTGSITASSTKYFLKQDIPQKDSDIFSEIYNNVYIDRITGGYYADIELLNLDVGAINSFVSRGTCDLEDNPQTKY